MADIVIAGGGLTGVMMATTLSFTPYEILHIDFKDKSRPADTIRTTTINAAGQRMLDALGVWDRLDGQATPIQQLRVTEGPAPSGLAARRKRAGLGWRTDDAPMAYVVRNDKLMQALEMTRAARGVVPLESQRVTGFKKSDGGACVTTETTTGKNAEIECQLAVACDGRNSIIAKTAGIKRRELPTGQTAIVAILTAERPHENTAFQRFLPGGPIALMPMDTHHLSLVWSLPNEEAERLKSVDDADFNEVCNRAVGNEFGFLTLQSDRLVWPLRPEIVSRPAAPNLIIAGDAAHPIHPLAGQGYNLALGDAAVLCDRLCEAHDRGLPAGHVSVTSGYVAGRRPEIMAMTLATSGLNAVFSKMPTALGRMAGIGMSFLDRAPVKSIFADIAQGGRLCKASLLDGKLPR